MKTFAALLLLVFLLPVAGWAETFVLATSEYKPFASRDGGLAMDIIDAALAEVGAEAQYVFVPWRRGEVGVLKGEYAGAFPYSSTPERRERFAFSDQVVVSKAVFFMLRDNLPGWDFGGMESLRGHSVACVLGYFYVERFREAGISCHPVPDIKSAFGMLLRGRVDLVVESEAIGWMQLRDLGGGRDTVRVAPTPLRKGVSAVMTSKASPEAARLRSKLNEGLARIRASGAYEEILSRYLPQ